MQSTRRHPSKLTGAVTKQKLKLDLIVKIITENWWSGEVKKKEDKFFLNKRHNWFEPVELLVETFSANIPFHTAQKTNHYYKKLLLIANKPIFGTQNTIHNL